MERYGERLGEMERDGVRWRDMEREMESDGERWREREEIWREM